MESDAPEVSAWKLPKADVLVTGGCGFIGHRVVRELAALGLRVRVLDDLSTGDASRLDGLPFPAVHGVLGDVADPTAVSAAVTGVQAVVHLAAKISVAESFRDPEGYRRTNAEGTALIVRAAKILRVPRLVYASTCAVYGDSGPGSPYAETKLAGEAAVERFESWAIIRLQNVYGPGQDASSSYSGVVAKFMEAVRSGKAIQINGDGLQSRDFVHVFDVARLFALLVIDSSLRGTFDAGTGRETSVLELARLCMKVGEREVPVTFGPSREGDVRKSAAPPQPSLTAAGWTPIIRLEEGLRELL